MMYLSLQNPMHNSPCIAYRAEIQADMFCVLPAQPHYLVGRGVPSQSLLHFDFIDHNDVAASRIPT